jgi:hypothetical protein
MPYTSPSRLLLPPCLLPQPFIQAPVAALEGAARLTLDEVMCTYVKKVKHLALCHAALLLGPGPIDGDSGSYDVTVSCCRP